MARESFQKTMDDLLLYIRAGYPVIYVVSQEESRVLDCLARIYSVILCGHRRKRFFKWTQTTGLCEIQGIAPSPATGDTVDWLRLPASYHALPGDNSKADAALLTIERAATANNEALSDSVTVFFDVHPSLESGALPLGDDLVRPLRNAATALRRYYDQQRMLGDSRSKTIVIVSPSHRDLSPELERDVIRVLFPLPEHDELLAAIQAKINGQDVAFPDPVPAAEIERASEGGPRLSTEAYRERVCSLVASAGRGLTLEDFKLGVNMIGVQGKLLCLETVETMLDLKKKAVSNRALTYTPHVDVPLGGLDAAKEWINKRRGAAASEEVRRRFQLPPPRGVLLCGVSGGGKSQLAKLIARQFNLALLRLDIGALFGQYVGESEQRAREALALAEVLAPVVLWIDEIDKAFKGMGAGGDNGVSARVFGYFLTWLSEKQDSIFVVATANDPIDLLDRFPEFGRKGRFDQIFWVGRPDARARAEIFSIYLKEARDTEFLLVSDHDVEEIAAQKNIGEVKGRDTFERLCDVLAHNDYSERLTGAEIEYLVNLAKYSVYSRATNSSERPALKAQDLAAAALDVMQHALYHAGAADAAPDARAEQYARTHGWLFVN